LENPAHENPAIHGGCIRLTFFSGGLKKLGKGANTHRSTTHEITAAKPRSGHAGFVASRNTPILHLKAKIATKWISRTIGKSGFGFYMCKIEGIDSKIKFSTPNSLVRLSMVNPSMFFVKASSSNLPNSHSFQLSVTSSSGL
jgi:hypothetical protein